jgi:hypothetical protein
MTGEILEFHSMPSIFRAVYLSASESNRDLDEIVGGPKASTPYVIAARYFYVAFAKSDLHSGPAAPSHFDFILEQLLTGVDMYGKMKL